MQKLQKDFFIPTPFLARYKPYCIQVVSPIIETYLTTSLSITSIVDKKYPYLPIDYRSVRLCIRNLISKMDDIYPLVMSELFQSNLSWNLSDDLLFLEIPAVLNKKLLKTGSLDLHRFFVIMEHYMASLQTKTPNYQFPHSSWLLLANHLLFTNTYSTIF
jgi:hypothetical protein